MSCLFSAGLIECTPDDFDGYFEILENKWECHSDAGKKFAEYFKKNKLSDMRDSMLLEHRVSAGIGLDVYTEDVRKMQLDPMVEHLRIMSKKQQSASEWACVEETDGVTLHEDYGHLKISQGELYGTTSEITPAMRTGMLQRIHKAKLVLPITLEVVRELAHPKM